MTAFSLGLFTFVCAFGGALIGSYARSMLPPPHLSKESQDVMRLGMGLVATMTALLLGLVTASARSTFDSQDVSVRTSAANILTLDRLLARYGPETATPRELLRQTLTYRIEEIWPSDGSRGGGLSTMPLASPPVENLENMILALSPANDGQRWIKTEALKISQEVVKARWRILTSQGGTVSMVFLGVVIFWLTVTFASFGLYAPMNTSVAAVLFVSALSVAAAVFLLIELDAPFAGVIKISSTPMRFALAQLGQ